MKILVTGATGQVARSLVEIAKARAIDLVAMGRPELDLTIPDNIEHVIGKHYPDIVVNAAAYTAVDKAEEEGGRAIAVNRYGAGVLAATCNEHQIPIIHLSTDYVFDGQKKTSYTETDETNPLGLYGHSKLEGDRAVAAANPHHVILRTSWVYSPFGSNFVKTMLRLAQTHTELNVVDDQTGCPTYAPHLAEGILQVIASLFENDPEQRPWGLYNIAGSGDASWCGFAREIFAQSKIRGGPSVDVNPITTAQYPTKAQRPANSRLDCAKFERVIGIGLPDWRQGTADCIARLLR